MVYHIGNCRREQNDDDKSTKRLNRLSVVGHNTKARSSWTYRGPFPEQS